MLVISTWLWGTEKYGVDDVAKLAAGVRRHLKQPHRFVCFSERHFRMDGVACGIIPDLWLTKMKGCYARLRVFDPAWQEARFDDRLVTIDLDTVITGELDPLFDRPEPFVILQGANAANPCPFNGSLQLLRAGAHPEVWADFSIEAARAAPFYEFPDDQGWIAHKVPGAAGWKAGSESGVYAFCKPGWPPNTHDLPADARMVVFPGWRDPSKFTHLPWVKEHWR